MPRTLARFRVSIKDHESGDRMKLELIEAPDNEVQSLKVSGSSWKKEVCVIHEPGLGVLISEFGISDN